MKIICTAAIAASLAASAAIANNPSKTDGVRMEPWEQSYRDTQNQQSRGYWDPQAVTIVGYDLDQDGRTDAWYQVTRYEFEQMRRDMDRSRGQPVRGTAYGHPMDQRSDYRSADRTRGSDMHSRNYSDSAGFAHGNRTGYRDSMSNRDRSYADSRARNRTVNGVLKDVKTFTFANDSKEHVVGKLRTNSGNTIPVHFGLKSELDTKLESGDQITVTGREGRLNDRRIIIAQRVRTSSDDFSIARSEDGNLRRLSGRVESVKPISLRSGDQSMLAKIRTDHGRIATVALGKKSSMNAADVDISQGDRVSILGRRAMIDNKPIVLAKHLCIGDQKVTVTPSSNRLRNAARFAEVYNQLNEF